MVEQEFLDAAKKAKINVLGYGTKFSPVLTPTQLRVLRFDDAADFIEKKEIWYTKDFGDDDY